MGLGFFKKKKEEKVENEKPAQPFTAPDFLKVEKSFTREDVEKARSELRVSSVEKEILSESLTRLYEAAAEGRITPEERDRLVAKYREQLSKIDSVLDYNQKIISLYELEETRAELVKMFQEKFKEINVKIDEIRRKLGVAPKQVEVKVPVVKEVKPVVREKPTPTPTPSTPRRSKADEELEKLRQDLQKELEKLEQIELEG